jgi:dihydroorotate dehydrogenase (NAD+) catalytic subunit
MWTILPNIPRERYRKLSEVDLTVQLGDLECKNPVFTASGTYGYGKEYSEMVNIDHWGALVTKSVTLHKMEGNPPPRLVETEFGLLNSVGLANVGVQQFIEGKLPFLHSLDTRIIVNVAGFSVPDYAEVIRLLDGETGIDAYEINVSCPNVDDGCIIGTDPDLVHELISSLRTITYRPLFLKLTPNVTSIGTLAQAADHAGADGFSVINTIYGMALDLDQGRPSLQRVIGGYSGPAIKPIALAKVWEVRQATSLPIIGIGGICTAKDVLDFMVVGASAVQIGTAAMRDPGIVDDILQDLNDYAVAHNITRIQDLVGTVVVSEDIE